MKKLNYFISEKLKLSKDTKVQTYDTIDIHDTDMLAAIMKAAFISIRKNLTYTYKTFSTIKIKKSKINYEDIVSILKKNIIISLKWKRLLIKIVNCKN